MAPALRSAARRRPSVSLLLEIVRSPRFEMPIWGQNTQDQENQSSPCVLHPSINTPSLSSLQRPPIILHMHILDVCLSYHIQAALHVLCPFLCLLTYREGLIQGLNETKLVVLDTQVCIPSTSGQEHCEGWMTQGLTPHTAKNVLRWLYSVYFALRWLYSVYSEQHGEFHRRCISYSVWPQVFCSHSTSLPIQS